MIRWGNAEKSEPLTAEEIALIRQRLQRLRDARLPLGPGDILDERFLATLDAARPSGVAGIIAELVGAESDVQRGIDRLHRATDTLATLDAARPSGEDVERRAVIANFRARVVKAKGTQQALDYGQLLDWAWDEEVDNVRRNRAALDGRREEGT